MSGVIATLACAGIVVAVWFRRRVLQFFIYLIGVALAKAGVRVQARSYERWRVSDLQVSLSKGPLSEVSIQHAALYSDHTLWGGILDWAWRSGKGSVRVKVQLQGVKVSLKWRIAPSPSKRRKKGKTFSPALRLRTSAVRFASFLLTGFKCVEIEVADARASSCIELNDSTDVTKAIAAAEGLMFTVFAGEHALSPHVGTTLRTLTVEVEANQARQEPATLCASQLSIRVALKLCRGAIRARDAELQWESIRIRHTAASSCLASVLARIKQQRKAPGSAGACETDTPDRAATSTGEDVRRATTTTREVAATVDSVEVGLLCADSEAPGDPSCVMEMKTLSIACSESGVRGSNRGGGVAFALDIRSTQIGVHSSHPSQALWTHVCNIHLGLYGSLSTPRSKRQFEELTLSTDFIRTTLQLSCQMQADRSSAEACNSHPALDCSPPGTLMHLDTLCAKIVRLDPDTKDISDLPPELSIDVEVSRARLLASSDELDALIDLRRAVVTMCSALGGKDGRPPAGSRSGKSGHGAKQVLGCKVRLHSLEVLYTSSSVHPVYCSVADAPASKASVALGFTGITLEYLPLGGTASKCSVECDSVTWGCSACARPLRDVPPMAEDTAVLRMLRIQHEAGGGEASLAIAAKSLEAALGVITVISVVQIAADAKVVSSCIRQATHSTARAQQPQSLSKPQLLISVDVSEVELGARLPSNSAPKMVAAGAFVGRISSSNIRREVALERASLSVQSVVVASCQRAVVAVGNSAYPSGHSHVPTDTSSVAVEASFDGVELILPHDLHLGAHVRDINLSVAALRELLMRNAPRKSSVKEAGPLLVQVTVTSVTLRAASPPWEAWLASRAPALKSTRCVCNLMSEAVMTETADSPSHAIAQDIPDAMGFTTESGCRNPREERCNISSYASALHCCSAQGLRGDESVEANCLLVSVTNIKAVFTIFSCQSKVYRSEALTFISNVDSYSESVQQSALRYIHAECSASSADVCLGGVREALVSMQGVCVSGTLAMARQATAPPQQVSLCVPLHSMLKLSQNVSVTARNCRPPWKLYTDGKVNVQNVTVCYSNAIQPLMKLVTVAVKRMTPPPTAECASRDSGVPPDETARTLPWWDRLRHQWRGKLRVQGNTACVNLAFGLTPAASQQEHLSVGMNSFRLDLESGRISLSAKDVEAGAMPHPGGSSKPWMQFEGILPIASIPVMEIEARLTFTLPGGRAQDAHYLWPVYTEPDFSDGLQGPVSIVEHFRAEQLQVVLAVKLQPPAGTREGRNGVVSQRLQSATPTLFVGERQLLWMRHWVKRAKSAPVYIAQASRLKQFKTAPRARDPTAKSIPRLLDDLQLSLSMLDFEVLYCGGDLDDPSSRLRATCDQLSLIMNLERQDIAKMCSTTSGLGQHAAETSRPWITEALLLDFVNTRFILSSDNEVDHSTLSSAHGPFSNKERILSTLFSMPPSPCTPQSLNNAPLRAGEEEVLNVATFSLKKQSPSSATDPNRNPLKMLMQEVRLYVTSDVLDSLVAMVDQLSGAFVAEPGKPRDQFQRREEKGAEGAETQLSEMGCREQDAVAVGLGGASPNEAAETPLAVGGDIAPDSATQGQDLLDLLRKDDCAEASTVSEADHLGGFDQSTTFAGQVTLTVDLHLFQMMVYSKEKNGQFLVCADNAQLIGMRGSAPPSEQSQSKIVALTSDAETIPSIARNEMVFSMEKMQGYINQTDIDPTANSRWLAVKNGALAPSPTSLVRRILQPARVELKLIKDRPAALPSEVPASAQRRSGTSGGSESGAGRSMQVWVTATGLDVDLNSREFGILTSCIASLSMVAPPNNQSMMAREQHLIWGKNSTMELCQHRQSVCQLRQRMKELQEARCILDSLQLPNDAGPSGHCPDVPGELPLPQLRSRLLRTLQKSNVSAWPSHDRPEDLSEALSLVLLFVRSALEETFVELNLQEIALSELAMEVKRSTASSSPSGETQLGLEIAHVGLSLLQEGDKPWVCGTLEGISFLRTAKVDKSGTIQARLANLELRDAERSLAATKGTAKGVIISHWDPASSWESEPTLLLLARHGPHSSGNQLVLQHLEIGLHPLGMHLTQTLASGLNEYFESASVDTEEQNAARAEAFASTLQNLSKSKPEPRPERRRPQGGGSGADLEAGAGDDGGWGSVGAEGATLSDLQASLIADGDEQPGLSKRGSVSLDTSPSKSRPGEEQPFEASEAWRRGHRRTVSDMSSLSTVTDRSGESSGFGGRPGLREGWRPATISTENLSPVAPMEQSTTPSSKKSDIRFAHVRVNQVSLLISYAGGPVPIRDLPIVLDKRVYINHIGHWHGLLSRFKWDAIKSILKSLTGLQGNKLRKIRQSLLPASALAGVDGGQLESGASTGEGAGSTSLVASGSQEAPGRLEGSAASEKEDDDARKPSSRGAGKPLAWMGSVNKMFSGRALVSGTRGSSEETAGAEEAPGGSEVQNGVAAVPSGRGKGRRGKRRGDTGGAAVSDTDKERLLFGSVAKRG